MPFPCEVDSALTAHPAGFPNADAWLMAQAKVAFVVNSGASAPMGLRACEFERRLRDDLNVVVAFRGPSRVGAIAQFLRFLRRERPDVVYVFDVAYSGIAAAALFKLLTRTPIVVDTGDAIFELARSGGLRGPIGLVLTWLLEKAAFAMADQIVVRGTKHRELLARAGRSAVVIQDGVDTAAFQPRRDEAIRRQLGISDVVSVGVLGSLAWSHRLGVGYGWDLVEALRALAGAPVKGVIIGSGPGKDILQRRVTQYGLADKIAFVDAVPFESLPAYLGSIDIWLSTQTNDIPGNVRTTGKLPLYMAAGAYVLASDVGEASIVLPRDMLIEYQGVVDHAYPARVAERIRSLVEDPTRLCHGAQNRPRAQQFFEYDMLAERVKQVITSVLAR